MSNRTSPLNPERLAQAKAAYTTRRVDFSAAETLLFHDDITPNGGDLVLARVEKIREHKKLELATGRRAHLFVGDEVVVCYGNRYAPDQFEAIVPDTLAPCHLIASGGIAARLLSKHERVKNPTVLAPLGLLGDIHGQPLNLANFSLKLKKSTSGRPSPVVLAVVGTSMNAGKTTTAANFIRGLTAAGQRVAAAKVTGTGAGGDIWRMVDAGAHPVLDIIDGGVPSTSRAPLERIQEILTTFLSHLYNAGADTIVLEVADGLYQEETAGLLSSSAFKDSIDGVIFVAGDAVGARAGAEWLQHRGLPVLALSGVFTRSPLATREAQEATGMPILTLKALRDPAMGATLKDWLKRLKKQPISMQTV